jgi:hypothetical protein
VVNTVCALTELVARPSAARAVRVVNLIDFIQMASKKRDALL